MAQQPERPREEGDQAKAPTDRIEGFGDQGSEDTESPGETSDQCRAPTKAT